MTNTFSYKQVWISGFQKSNWTMPVYPVIADTQFSDGLKMGDTIHRRYRSSPIFSNDLSSSGGYTPQNYVESDQTFVIAKQKEASVRIVATEVLHTDLPTTESYGAQLSNAIYETIDSDTLYTAYANAGQALDDGSFGGTAGNGLAVSIGNIANIPVLAMEKFMGANVVYSNNMRFGKLPYEDYGGMLTWVIPPQVWSIIQLYFMVRNTPHGDEVITNGYTGMFGQFNTFVNNHLPFTARLALSVNPTDGDTITINGVVITFKTTVDAGTTAGQVKIASTAALTVTNLTAFLNAPTTTVADATNAGYNGFAAANTVTDNTYTIPKSRALQNVIAVDGTTFVTFTKKGMGKVTLASSFTSASNLWTAAKQNIQSLFIIAKNVCLAIRKDPEIYDNPVSNSIARDYVLWTVYDNKVFQDQARAIISLAIDCSAGSFATYSQVHA